MTINYSSSLNSSYVFSLYRLRLGLTSICVLAIQLKMRGKRVKINENSDGEVDAEIL